MKVNYLIMDEIRDDLNIRIVILNMKGNEENESEVSDDLALFGGQSKSKCRNCGNICHEAQDYKIKTQQNGGNYRNSQNSVYCTYCCRSGQLKRNYFTSSY
jgi:hypothetical protein